MLLRFFRASWQPILVSSAALALSALVFVPRGFAQSSISVTVSPTTASVATGGGAQQFTATVRNDRHHRGVRWTLSGAGCSGSTCGTLSATTSASGTPITYTAPLNVPNPATVTLTATSVSNTSRKASATITLTTGASVSVSISPTSASVSTSNTRSFTASVTNDLANQGVTWALTQSATSCAPACGTLSGQTTTSVTYTAPVTVPANPVVTLTATSVRDSTKSASASITVTTSAAVSVAISPKRAGLAITQALSVTATVQNDVSAAGVTWSASGPACSGSACGTFTNVTKTSATYVAPSTPGSYAITATSVADVTKSASNSIGVTDLSGVFTYHNNISRDGTNTHEFALIPALVSTTTFGKLFSCPADGAIYTQPLWLPNLTVAGSSHNVIIVATQHESLYAFDADASPCTILWHANLIDTAHGGTSGETSVPSSGTGALVGSGFGDISPEVGVTGTPVIDPATNTLYVVGKSVNASTQFFQRLHAIDLTTGNERVTPRSIDSSISVPGTGAGSVSGQVAFDPREENQRPGLALSNGVVYVAWASHEDHDPYHGWVIGFNASTLALVANGIFNSTPNQVGTLSYSRGGIWMSGGAPAVDSSGNVFFITGNGTFDANAGGSNYGDSVVKLSTASGLSVADYFTPLDQATLDANDTDFGSGAATVLIDQPTGPVTHLLIGGGKQGNLFLLNRDNLGKFSSSTNNVVQTINLSNSIFATPAFWQNNLYVAGVGPLKQFAFNATTGRFNGAPSSQSSTSYGFPGATPSLSSNGTTNAIVWALDNTYYCTPQSPGCAATVLHAYDATNLATELWNSSQAAGNRDMAGHAVKFTVPTVANGKVYVGTRGNDSTVLGELEVYGLLPN
ncbi:MAG: hypothetical protein WBL63_10070 [Candidatus Acidiferrum sp.]